MRPYRRLVIAFALLAVALVGCTPKADFNARFVRYETLQDGLVVAVVRPIAEGAQPEEQKAYVSRRDLRPGELVGVRVTGRDWDVPQWMPDREIVSPVAE